MNTILPYASTQKFIVKDFEAFMETMNAYTGISVIPAYDYKEDVHIISHSQNWPTTKYDNEIQKTDFAEDVYPHIIDGQEMIFFKPDTQEIWSVDNTGKRKLLGKINIDTLT